MSKFMAQYRKPTIEELQSRIIELEFKVAKLIRHNDMELERQNYANEMAKFSNGGIFKMFNHNLYDKDV